MREILDTGFGDDDGTASPEVVAALSDGRSYPAALSVLQSSRLLVPVVAVLGEVEVDDAGLARDKSSDMAAVLLQGRDGRLALLAFTSMDAMTAWDPDARPVPVSAQAASQAALQDKASAIVVDLAGPNMFVIETEDVESLAAGQVLLPIGDRYAWAAPSEPPPDPSS
jgi:hypothetical protein